MVASRAPSKTFHKGSKEPAPKAEPHEEDEDLEGPDARPQFRAHRGALAVVPDLGMDDQNLQAIASAVGKYQAHHTADELERKKKEERKRDARDERHPASTEEVWEMLTAGGQLGYTLDLVTIKVLLAKCGSVGLGAHSEAFQEQVARLSEQVALSEQPDASARTDEEIVEEVQFHNPEPLKLDGAYELTLKGFRRLLRCVAQLSLCTLEDVTTLMVWAHRDRFELTDAMADRILHWFHHRQRRIHNDTGKKVLVRKGDFINFLREAGVMNLPSCSNITSMVWDVFALTCHQMDKFHSERLRSRPGMRLDKPAGSDRHGSEGHSFHRHGSTGVGHDHGGYNNSHHRAHSNDGGYGGAGASPHHGGHGSHGGYEKGNHLPVAKDMEIIKGREEFCILMEQLWREFRKDPQQLADLKSPYVMCKLFVEHSQAVDDSGGSDDEKHGHKLSEAFDKKKSVRKTLHGEHSPGHHGSHSPGHSGGHSPAHHGSHSPGHHGSHSPGHHHGHQGSHHDHDHARQRSHGPSGHHHGHQAGHEHSPTDKRHAGRSRLRTDSEGQESPPGANHRRSHGSKLRPSRAASRGASKESSPTSPDDARTEMEAGRSSAPFFVEDVAEGSEAGRIADGSADESEGHGWLAPAVDPEPETQQSQGSAEYPQPAASGEADGMLDTANSEFPEAIADATVSGEGTRTEEAGTIQQHVPTQGPGETAAQSTGTEEAVALSEVTVSGGGTVSAADPGLPGSETEVPPAGSDTVAGSTAIPPSTVETPTTQHQLVTLPAADTKEAVGEEAHEQSPRAAASEVAAMVEALSPKAKSGSNSPSRRQGDMRPTTPAGDLGGPLIQPFQETRPQSRQLRNNTRPFHLEPLDSPASAAPLEDTPSTAPLPKERGLEPVAAPCSAGGLPSGPPPQWSKLDGAPPGSEAAAKDTPHASKRRSLGGPGQEAVVLDSRPSSSAASRAAGSAAGASRPGTSASTRSKGGDLPTNKSEFTWDMLSPKEQRLVAEMSKQRAQTPVKLGGHPLSASSALAASSPEISSWAAPARRRVAPAGLARTSSGFGGGFGLTAVGLTKNPRVDTAPSVSQEDGLLDLSQHVGSTLPPSTTSSVRHLRPGTNQANRRWVGYPRRAETPPQMEKKWGRKMGFMESAINVRSATQCRIDAKIKDIQRKFNELDLDHDGLLNYDEFQMLVRKGDRMISDREAGILFRTADANGDGKVHCEEFVDFVLSAGKIAASAMPQRSPPRRVPAWSLQ
mmetsp:Transcript_45174/g.107500  ORF Transcript_45174/g.107500 Transcript_45174/m.107500 type:complete len:1247 (+) Transcript_45174:82-3822(+)